MTVNEEIRQELRNFGERTSIKGVSRTLRSHSRIVRLCWLAALLACFAALLLQVFYLAISYYSYGVTNTFLYVSSQPNFPDVTICNFLPIANEKQFFELYDAYLQKIKFIEKQAPDDIKQSLAEYENFLRLIDNFNVNVPLLEEFYSNQELNDLIVSANFYDWDLFEKRLCRKVPTLNKPLQLCTTLRPNSSAAAISAVVFINNLMPTLFDTYYDWDEVPLASGVEVMIHPKGTKPDDQVAVYVPPGTSITIDVQQNNVTRLPHPYGSCIDRQKIFPEEESSPYYSQALCVSLCRQRQYIDNCGCLSNYEFFTDAELEMGNNTFCLNVTKHLENPLMYNTEQGTLTELFWSVINCTFFFATSDDICDCPVPCSEIQYDVGSSFSNWPNVHYQLAFYDVAIRNDVRYREKFLAYETLLNDSYGQSDAETLKELRKLKLIEENFLQVSVRMSQRMVQLIRDVPAMSWDTVTANLGGSFNLWLGVSVLTAVEILELIYSLVCIAVARIRTQSQDTRL